MKCLPACNANLRVGTKVQHCTACHEDFSTEANGDKHRVAENGTRRCLTSSEMTERGMRQNAKGVWVSGQNPLYAV